MAPGWIFLAIGIFVFTILLWPEKEIKHPPGIIVMQEPVQTNTFRPEWEHKSRKLRPLAEYSITGRVLAKNHYRMDPTANISPYDFLLGWGVMSDQTIIDMAEPSVGSRFGSINLNGKSPFPYDVINSHVSNNHLIPANDEVEELMSKVVKGNIVRITGSLVALNEPRTRWQSSVSRYDKGPGACEIIWVERLEILQ